MHDPLDPTPAFMEALDAAVTRVAAGAPVEEERVLCTHALKARGAHAGNGAFVLRLLANFFASRGRMFEALVVARALLGRVEGRSETREADALILVGRVLHAVGLTGPAADILARVDRIPEASRHASWLTAHEEALLRCVLAIDRGDAVDARRWHARILETLDPADVDAEARRVGAATYEARILTIEGRYEEVDRVFPPVTEVPGAQASIPLGPVRARFDAALAAGRRDAARPHAEALLHMIQERLAQRSAVVQCLACGEALARFFAADPPAPELEQAAVEVVAASILWQLVEIHTCLGHLADIGIDPEPARVDLLAYRQTFASRHAAALRRIAEMLASGDAEIPAFLVQERGDEQFVAICAWCASVRSDDGTWSPIGQFIPHDAPLAVSHGICPACVKVAMR